MLNKTLPTSKVKAMASCTTELLGCVFTHRMGRREVLLKLKPQFSNINLTVTYSAYSIMQHSVKEQASQTYCAPIGRVYTPGKPKAIYRDQILSFHSHFKFFGHCNPFCSHEIFQIKFPSDMINNIILKLMIQMDSK